MRISKTLKISIITILSVLVIISCVLLISRFQYQNGINFMNEKGYDKALASFTHAEKLIPRIFNKTLFPQDQMCIHTKKGIILHDQGLALWKEKGISDTVFTLYKKAGTSLAKADKIDPGDYITTYWLAKTQNALESISGYLMPREPNPYNAQSLYEKAITLRPSGISVHYSYLRYLYNKGETKPIPQLVQYMTRIYPPSYHHLKKEPFFNNSLLANMEAGLLSALERNTTPRSALQALSDIQVKKQDYKKAIAHYRESLEIKPFTNTSNNYLDMGRLYLKIQAPEKTSIWFTKALKASGNFNAAHKRIFYIYEKEKALNEFIRFSSHAEKNLAHTPDLDLNIAKAWIKMEKPQLARARLIKLNAEKPNAGAHYLLAKIAEKEKDWDQVEISA
ncbi:hypothetical protein KAH94_04005, partial [bacterium]|nr:hypothetical protein [bacterium]